MTVRFGVHLPLADFGDQQPTAAALCAYASAARQLGYTTLAANDHLVWRRPWLDGPTALAAVLSAAGDMTVATTISLPVVRHPVVLAKALSTVALLAQGPLIAGLGPGSARADYAAVGCPFEERWARFDEALALVRALLRGEAVRDGVFYPAEGLRLDPLLRPAPQVWLGSWGSERRLQAMAGGADGWLASGYNLTPDQYRGARARLDGHLRQAGRDPAGFPDAIATMWLYITDDPARARTLLADVLAPALGRDPDRLAGQLPIGVPEHCAEVLSRYAAAGAQEIYLWPVRDPIDQLERCAAQVLPLLRRQKA
jgi:alkanesulfonate monooxygenase SsuD/methylene tetrahydromethanopterin reductase-like flavin-dependent oxidoreductase (luciferase family)